ncbi:MAG: VIT1/CCC1 transporter family protein [Candidatus Uhrbacteria bacterium]|nr:VIT1/CCC1 transporter family protein [Candidatus Uhrbacteria bacterium]
MEEKSLQHEIVDSMREIVFGLEDSLVSTMGAITGIAVGTGSQYIVILSGLVLIAAEATSMAAGSYLSTKHAREAEILFHERKGLEVHDEASHPIRAAIVMGVFYLLGGVVPLAPYFLLPVDQAVFPAIIITACSLFLVGVWAASFTKTSKLRSGIEMTLVSLAAAGIGYVIGHLVASYFGVNI